MNNSGRYYYTYSYAFMTSSLNLSSMPTKKKRGSGLPSLTLPWLTLCQSDRVVDWDAQWTKTKTFQVPRTTLHQGTAVCVSSLLTEKCQIITKTLSLSSLLWFTLRGWRGLSPCHSNLSFSVWSSNLVVVNKSFKTHIISEGQLKYLHAGKELVQPWKTCQKCLKAKSKCEQMNNS